MQIEGGRERERNRERKRVVKGLKICKREDARLPRTTSNCRSFAFQKLFKSIMLLKMLQKTVL